MELNEYQRLANTTDQRPRPEGEGQEAQVEAALVFPLMGLASEVGSLLTQYKKRIRDGDAHELFGERVAEELGDIMWYVANLASKIGLDLEGVAALNLKRVTERWPAAGAPVPEKLLDDDFPEAEQLPRKATVRFDEVEVDGKLKLQITCEGQQLGSFLTDMNYDEDHYRYHDAFHLAYAALLGWSPVARSFFDVRRNSSERVREVEDGGRAVVIEEAISAHVFNYARQEAFLDGVGAVDAELLRTVADLCSHLEVRVRSSAEWQHAILRSFEIWRHLREDRGGLVHLDLRARSIEYEPAD